MLINPSFLRPCSLHGLNSAIIISLYSAGCFHDYSGPRMSQRTRSSLPSVSSHRFPCSRRTKFGIPRADRSNSYLADVPNLEVHYKAIVRSRLTTAWWDRRLTRRLCIFIACPIPWHAFDLPILPLGSPRDQQSTSSLVSGSKTPLRQQTLSTFWRSKSFSPDN
jgi:hypothetical protein